jgi:two-component sensor histidine kinase
MADDRSNSPRLSFRNTPAGGLVSAIEQLAAARCIEDVIDTVRATARRLLGSDGITIILREGHLCHYVEEDAIGPLWKGGKFPLTACISGWAMLNAEPAIIPDIYADDRIPHDLYRPTFVKSLMMVPVRVDDPIAAIGCYWASNYEPSDEEIETLTTLAQAAATAIENANLIEQLNKALSDAELARDELRHRVKNAFASAGALARLSMPAEHAAPLAARLSALARAHELLDEKLSRQHTVTLQDLIDAELAPYEIDSTGMGRLALAGPQVTIDAEQAVSLGLALNELAANALKYGALSTPRGRLDVTWRIRGGYVVIEWTESDGPEVKAAAAENFGSRLLKRLVEYQLGGAITRELRPTGARCSIEFPLGQVVARESESL